MKLRGYRIELGEIEAAALAAPGVTLAAALVRTLALPLPTEAEVEVKADAALQQLILYVTPRNPNPNPNPDPNPSPSPNPSPIPIPNPNPIPSPHPSYVTPADVSVDALRATLRRLLPAHAQPNMVLPQPRLPTNAAGKLAPV